MSWGVIDHCVFDGKGYGVIESASYTEAEYPTPAKGIGAYSWDWPLNLGTDEAVYAEDNVWNFTSDTISAVNDQVYGARQVFRHNTINHAFIQTHSTRANDRGGLKYEIYDNIFNGTGFIWPMFFRSGTGVIFNNTITGYSTNNIIVDNQRSCIAYTGKFPRCDGNSSVDGNVPGESGWPCLDQIGRGPGTFGNQPSVPLYAWNNGSAKIKVNGNFDLCLNTGTTQTLATHIKSTPHSNGEVDFVNNGTTPKPGYIPYTYPHPLTISGFTSDAGGPVITVPVGNPAPATPPQAIIPPVTPPVTPPTVPPVTLPPTTPTTPAVPSIISRILPSFTSPTRTPTTPSSVTTRRTTPSGPFVPLPEATPEGISSSTERTSFTTTIKDILSYIISRIERGIQRVIGVNSAEAATVNVTSPTSLTTGLVGWWTMDGPNMLTNVKDSSGNNNNGAMINFTSTSTAVVPGKIGQGLYFDGVNDYVTIANSSVLKPSLPLTISAWMRVPSYGTISAEIDGDNSTNYYGYSLGINASGLAYVQFGDGLGSGSQNRRSKVPSTTLSLNRWYHVVGVIRGATDMDVYIDAVDAGGTYSGTGGTMAYGSGPTDIGRHLPGGVTFYSKALYDDVRIYNRALSATEVKQLYNTTVGSKQAASPNVTATSTCSTGLSCGLVGYWTFDGPNMLTNVKDSSGSNNNGFMSGFTSTSTAVVPGKIGQGLKFDGVNDYVSTGIISALSGVSKASISAWIYKKSASNTVAAGQYNGTYRFGFVWYSDNNLYIEAENGDFAYCTFAAPQTTGWHHLTMIFDGTQSVTGCARLSAYWDGQSKTLGGLSGTLPSNLASGGNQSPFRMGMDYSGGNRFWSGSLDDVRIVDCLLSNTRNLSHISHVAFWIQHKQNLN
jgi:hypothetical protein